MKFLAGQFTILVGPGHYFEPWCMIQSTCTYLKQCRWKFLLCYWTLYLNQSTLGERLLIYRIISMQNYAQQFFHQTSKEAIKDSSCTFKLEQEDTFGLLVFTAIEICLLNALRFNAKFPTNKLSQNGLMWLYDLTGEKNVPSGNKIWNTVPLFGT